jgi:hypothetical protein
MNVSELVDNLIQQGVKLSINKNKLEIHSPVGVLTPHLKSELTTHKTKIIDYLQEQQNDYAINMTDRSSFVYCSQGLSVATIGRLIGGFDKDSLTEFKSPIIDPQISDLYQKDIEMILLLNLEVN